MATNNTSNSSLLALLDQSDLAYMLDQHSTQEGKETLKAQLVKKILIDLIRQQLEA